MTNELVKIHENSKYHDDIENRETIEMKKEKEEG